jgi:hypothetical protein
MKTCTFYNGENKVVVTSDKFRTIRAMASTGIPKGEIKAGANVYVAATQIGRISKLIHE